MTLQALLNDITEWQADAGVLVRRRSELLARARRLKALGAVRDLLAVPRVGDEPAAIVEPPSPYPSQPGEIVKSGVVPYVADPPPHPLDVPAALRRK